MRLKIIWSQLIVCRVHLLLCAQRTHFTQSERNNNDKNDCELFSFLFYAKTKIVLIENYHICQLLSQAKFEIYIEVDKPLFAHNGMRADWNPIALFVLEIIIFHSYMGLLSSYGEVRAYRTGDACAMCGLSLCMFRCRPWLCEIFAQSGKIKPNANNDVISFTYIRPNEVRIKFTRAYAHTYRTHDHDGENKNNNAQNELTTRNAKNKNNKTKLQIVQMKYHVWRDLCG